MRAALAIVVALGACAAPRPRSAHPQADARTLARRAQSHFDLGEYDRAAADLRAAYHLQPSPGVLYNLGQAYRLDGDCTHATTMYRAYQKAEPGSPQRAMVDQHLESLEPCAEQRGQSRLRWRIAGLALAGGGALLAGAGMRTEERWLLFAGGLGVGAGATVFAASWRF